MKRAIQVTKINRQFIVDVDGDPLTLVPLPPAPHWFVRGPRGGLYVATGARERFVAEDRDDFLMNTVSVVDRSAGLKYVRPRSRLARDAEVVA